MLEKAECGQCNKCKARRLRLQTAVLLNQCAVLSLKHDALFSEVIGGTVDSSLGLIFAVHQFDPPPREVLS